MSDDLLALRVATMQSLAAADDLRAWDAIRVATLGKSGALTTLLKELGKTPPEQRRERGAALNALKTDLAAAIETRRTTLDTEALAARLAAERVDISLPPRREPAGSIHPISRTLDEMYAIFGAMGFAVAEGPDIESDWHNFSALNIPGHHPARDDHDTFYLPGYLPGDGGAPRVLRTHTSPVQIRTMLDQPPPIRVIVPGRTYRADHDATHSPMFHQCEGLVIDRDITLGHLKGCLTDFLRAFFGIATLPVRFRASYFPFTEPSMEVDIGWRRSTGEIGAGTDWLEILGSGMVHPKVLANCGIDPRAWQGFAFGMGVERITMLKHGMPDLRPFYDSDLRWLRHYGTSPFSPASLHEGYRRVKFTLSWLRTHLQTSASLDEITTTLSSIGLEVDGVIDRAAPLAPFLTARIVEAVQHPNADRLRACRVDAGTGETISVVCGAPNARTGLHAVFAPPGAFIPGSGITLKVGEIRGVASAGMLVSTREMGLGDEHDGIVELPDATPVGLPYAAWAGLDDPVVEISVTPNRGDALSVRGIARDLAAAGLGTLQPWSPEPVPALFETGLRWAIDWPQACPWVLGRSIRGVVNRPSPDWLQRRLRAIGLRPISALVDITNFFTFDLGRPLHVFDADRLAGDTLTLRRGAGETLVALNGRDYTVGCEDLVIADAGGVVSLAGIMGGQASGTQDDTRHVFVECALFDPVVVARAGRRHQIASDARQRFERGVDQSLLPAALEAATRMIVDLCGGQAGSVVSAGTEPAWRRQASLRFERLSGLGGADTSPGEASAILQRLGFSVTAQGNSGLLADVPPWRNDVANAPGLDQAPALDNARAQDAAAGAAALEPECDLIEEVLRIRGLDTIPPVSLPVLSAVPMATLSPGQTRTALARRLLASRGLAECVTYSFGPRAALALFGPVPDSLTLRNPIAADLDQMRPTPLATLAPAAARNIARGATEAALFEIGPGFLADGQQTVAAALRVGQPARSWSPTPPTADAMGAKADLWALLAGLGVPLEALSLTRDAPSHYHPGQSATVRQGPKTVLAHFGALHPTLLQHFDLPEQSAAFELFLDSIAGPKRRRRAPPDLPVLQPVARDFAFVVSVDTAAETVLKAARSADRTLIAQVNLFDVYNGPNVLQGQKSLGLEVVFQPRDRTLTEEDIDAASTKVVQSVAKATGAYLR